MDHIGHEINKLRKNIFELPTKNFSKHDFARDDIIGYDSQVGTKAYIPHSSLVLLKTKILLNTWLAYYHAKSRHAQQKNTHPNAKERDVFLQIYIVDYRVNLNVQWQFTQ